MWPILQETVNVNENKSSMENFIFCAVQTIGKSWEKIKN